MIRQLTTADIPEYRAMQALYAAAFDDEQSYLRKPPPDGYVRSVLDDPSCIALVAEKESEIIGALSAYVLRKFEQARSEVYIYDLAVASGHRRQGVATALIAAAQKIAADRGAWVSFVQADHGDGHDQSHHQ